MAFRRTQDSVLMRIGLASAPTITTLPFRFLPAKTSLPACI